MKRIGGRIFERFIVFTQRAALLSLAGAILLFGLPSNCQTSTSARLSGSVTDPSGAVVPQVKVTAQNVGTNLSQSVESDSAGTYAFNSLPPGQYKLTTEHEGFAPLVETDVDLTVGQSATLNLSLKTGGAQDTITVSVGAELINTTTAKVSQVVNESTVKELPLNGRDPGQLVFLSA